MERSQPKFICATRLRKASNSQQPAGLLLLQRVLSDEAGGEVLEYAIVSGLIVVAAISVIGKIGGKVLARWGSLNSSM